MKSALILSSFLAAAVASSPLQASTSKGGETVDTLLQDADTAFRTGRYHIAEEKWSAVADMGGRAAPGKVLSAMEDLGFLYGIEARYDLEVEIRERELSLIKKTFGDRNKRVASSQHTLALAYLNAGRTEAAERRFLENRKLQAKLFGESSVPVARTMQQLAWIYRHSESMGRKNTAREMSEKALSILEKHFGQADPGTMRALRFHAEMLSSKDAEPFLRRALEVSRAAYSKDHPQIATSLVGLARSLWNRNETDQAEPLLLEALAIQEKSLGRSDAASLDTLQLLAAMALRKADLDRAQALYSEVLAARRQALPETDPRIARALFGLGEVHKRRGNKEKLEAVYRECLEIWESAYGRTHKYVLSTMADYVLLLRDLGRTKDAELLEAEIKSRAGDKPLSTFLEKPMFKGQ